MRGETPRGEIVPRPNRFQSTPLMRGETHLLQEFFKRHIDFNPLPSCEGRLGSILDIIDNYDFNPLPSCEGRREGFKTSTDDPRISIHSPHARGDQAGHSIGFDPSIFQSTPLMRGETHQMPSCTSGIGISIHSPHARGDLMPSRYAVIISISIHSPHARGDLGLTVAGVRRTVFQSTPLMRGETCFWCSTFICCKFQSTPLMRGETRGTGKSYGALRISIHSPHARGDNSDHG